MINNPVRGRLNAWFLAALDGYMHWKYADVKSHLFSAGSETIFNPYFTISTSSYKKSSLSKISVKNL